MQLENLFRLLKKIKKQSMLPLHSPDISIKDYNIIKNCVKSTNISTYSNYVGHFENKLKKYTKSKYVIATNSGTSALHLALMSFDIDEGDEILIPSLNYVAPANAIMYCNGSPHFVDVNKKTLSVDIEKLENYLKKILLKKKNFFLNKVTKKKVRGMIAFHPFGHAVEIDKLKKVLKKYKLFLIEDAAEAMGTFFKKKHMGTYGDVGVLSFNGNKIISTGGGGAVITNNKIKAMKILELATISRERHEFEFIYKGIGYNYRMPGLNAALGISQLNKLNDLIKKKRIISRKYEKFFKSNKNITYFKEPKNCKSNYWLNTIILKKNNLRIRNKFIKKCIKSGIQVRPIWKPLHTLSYLKKFPRMKLVNTSILMSKILSLPSSPNIKL